LLKRKEKEMDDINENQGLKKKLMSSEIGWCGVYGIGMIKLGCFNTPNLGLSFQVLAHDFPLDLRTIYQPVDSDQGSQAYSSRPRNLCRVISKINIGSSLL
jgi:hypothetical protein